MYLNLTATIWTTLAERIVCELAQLWHDNPLFVHAKKPNMYLTLHVLNKIFAFYLILLNNSLMFIFQRKII